MSPIEENDKNLKDIENPPYEFVVALKDENDPKQNRFGRFFSRPYNIGKKYRGFRIGSLKVFRKYKSQSEVGESSFKLLGHLMVLKNPFAMTQDKYIVILNGVSGPATYGLAEVLTGSTTVAKGLKSEEILGEINKQLEKLEKRSTGVESIIEVIVGGKNPDDKKLDEKNCEPIDSNLKLLENKSSDVRYVWEWNLLNMKNPRDPIDKDDPTDIVNLSRFLENPRSIPFISFIKNGQNGGKNDKSAK